MAKVPGIDVSRYQGVIDWKAVRAAGIRFAYIKATESTDYLDPTFNANWAGAKAAGIVRGAYHYFHSDEDAKRQASLFAQTVSLEPTDLPPALDVETDFGKLSVPQIVKAVFTCLTEVEQHMSRKPLVYTSATIWEPHLLSPSGAVPQWTKNYHLWVAHWGVNVPTKPKGWDQWLFWQYDNQGSCQWDRWKRRSRLVQWPAQHTWQPGWVGPERRYPSTASTTRSRTTTSAANTPTGAPNLRLLIPFNPATH